MPDTSSSENNLTGIAHHAQTHTEVQLQELLLTTEPESTSTESRTGELQLGREITREFHSTDTAQVTRNLPSTTEASLHVEDGYNKLIRKLNGSSSD